MHTIRQIILLSFAFIRTNGQHNPNFKHNRRAIVQLFEWKFADVANECETFLGKHNFGGVQVSQVNENIIIKGRPWCERLQPMSFKILTRSGNSHEFLDMTRRCEKVGVRVYVDIVINHMAAAQTEMIGTAGSTATYKNYPSAGYTEKDFHRTCSIQSYFDAFQVRNCELIGMPDLNHGSQYVRSKIVSFMNYLIDLGAAGFHVLHCKHMWPNELNDIYDALNNLREDFDFEPGARPFIMQEVLDFGEEPVSKTEYTSFGVVTEFLYSRDLSQIFGDGNNLTELFKLGPELGFLQSDDSLVDNHDTQRAFSSNDKMSLNFKSRKRYIMANAFLLAYPFGTIRLMSSYNFSEYDIQQGPPMDENEKILSVTLDDDGNCENGWICEHRWKPIVQMVNFRVNVHGTSITKRRVFDWNTVGFCREDKGFIVFTSRNFSSLVGNLIFVCVPEGKYCDVIAGYDENGNCLSIVDVDSESEAILFKTEGSNNNGILAVHVGSRLD
ncbi:alpha-amylase 2-like isoform X2 [Bradysia coprophila]|uniref:alpha-amylase 2-like isoform X2 n=1 Tax=Bradysia coprophila TaxID=38358 RepID=UPI00187D84C1|nr:alpha-amylase 2-like isoform X2 [Bradysia coprophila]